MSETKLTATAITNALREDEFAKLVARMENDGYEILQTKGAQFACPVLDGAGGERFLRVTVEIPKGDREGNLYDGYAEAKAFAAERAEKAAKDAENARKKAEKAAKAKAKA